MDITNKIDLILNDEVATTTGDVAKVPQGTKKMFRKKKKKKKKDEELIEKA